MGDVLAYNTSLQTLNLAGCLSSDGAKEIVTGIGVNRALVKYAHHRHLCFLSTSPHHCASCACRVRVVCVPWVGGVRQAGSERMPNDQGGVDQPGGCHSPEPHPRAAPVQRHGLRRAALRRSPQPLVRPLNHPLRHSHTHTKHAHTHTSEPVHRCRDHNDRDLRKHLLHVKVLHLGANNIAPTDRLQERIRNYPVTILFS